MSVSAHGVATVAAQEFRLRIRSGRWRWLLASWFGVLLLFTTLSWLASPPPPLLPDGERGRPMYDALILFVLAVALFVAPALTAQSVNGDRERGTLATLQVTLLTPAEIALGKLAAAWGTALVFLALSLPLVVWCFADPLARDFRDRGAAPGSRLRGRPGAVGAARAQHDIGFVVICRCPRPHGRHADRLQSRGVSDDRGAGQPS
jgi:hypothetical protein